VFVFLFQQECQFNGIRNLDNRVVINFAEKQQNWNDIDKQNNWKLQDQGSWKPQGRNNNLKGGIDRGRSYTQGKQCSYCHRLNHTIDECYAKHGYPPWYKQRNENFEREKSNDQSCNIILRSDDSQIHRNNNDQDIRQNNPPFTFKIAARITKPQCKPNTQCQRRYSAIHHTKPGKHKL